MSDEAKTLRAQFEPAEAWLREYVSTNGWDKVDPAQVEFDEADMRNAYLAGQRAAADRAQAETQS